MDRLQAQSRSKEILTRKKQSKLCEGSQARLGGIQDIRVDSERTEVSDEDLKQVEDAGQGL